MTDIKTKKITKDIKVLDKEAGVARNIKRATVRTKDGIENLIDDGKVSPSEYAEDRMKYAAEDVAEGGLGEASRRFRQGRERARSEARERKNERRLEILKKRTERKIEEFEKEQAQDNTPNTAVRVNNAGIRARKASERCIKQTEKSSGKAGIKTTQNSTKTAQRSVKTAEQTAKAAIKTSGTTAETTWKTAEAAAGASKATTTITTKAVASARKGISSAAKDISKAAVAAGKGIAASFRTIVTALGAGGIVTAVVMVFVCGIGLIVGSAFGIFFSGENAGGRTMESVVKEINDNYWNKIDEIKSQETYGEIEMSGTTAIWREVLAVYAVKTNMDPDSGQEVATLSEDKIAILKEIFWVMNTVEYEVRPEMKIVFEEDIDENGEIIETAVEKEVMTLYIRVTHRSAEEMADEYGFTELQKEQMRELLSDKYKSLWAAVLYGIHSDGTPIVQVARSQLGNVGGEPYWSYFGYTSRIAWCACFVSWCGNECGYIEAGIMPNSISCVASMNWYKQRGQWIDGNQEPVPGMIIFYDWDDPDGEFGPQDGKPDHTGIVEKVVDGIIYTIEGNVANSCQNRSHQVGAKEVMGFGIPGY